MNPPTNPLDSTLRALNNCDCCAGTHAQTPALIDNRPGLSALSFRAGTHGQFKASLLAALTDKDLPALAGLRTRDEEDFTIALLDGFAAMADVLTFYSERIANESYLRTAVERRSVLEMARGIGYELQPGVAAETWAAFTVEDAAGAPGWADVKTGTKVQSIPGPGEEAQTYETVEDFEARKEWNVLRVKRFRSPVRFAKKLWLAGGSVNVRVGDQVLIVGRERTDDSGSERWDVRRVIEIEKENSNDPLTAYTILLLEYGLGSAVPPVSPSDEDAKIYIFRAKANLFGWNAADWNLIDNEVRKHYMPRVGLETDAAWTARVAAQADWPNYIISAVPGSSVPDTDPDEENDSIIHLDSVQDSFVTGSWVALQTPGTGSKVAGYTELYEVRGNATDAKTGFGLSAKVTRLSLRGENLKEKFNDKLRETVVLGKSEYLDSARTEVNTMVHGASITLDSTVEGLEPGRLLIVTGTDSDGASRVEHVVLKEAAADADDPTVTCLTLEEPLLFAYAPSSVVVYGNAARVTHGESVAAEILGSGNAGSEHQKFALKQKPLTYIQSTKGATSSLSVYVNDVQWTNAPSLYGHGPTERIFTVRLDDDGTTRVIMSDGWFGARLPTGTENVAACYRKGIGLDGLVDAGQLTQLLNRPLGIRSAANPAASSGAADAETMGEARTNAPLTTLTLDRVVSMSDYTDYSRAFAGVAKAHAVWVWTARGRGVLVHVAGPEEAEFTAADALPGNLAAALLGAGNPLTSVSVRSGKVSRFVLAGTVIADSDRIAEDVKAALNAALEEAFSYDEREFGQAVALSEVMEILHSVPGVHHAALTTFDLSGGMLLKPRLTPSVPRPGDGLDAAPAAEVLVIDTDSLANLTVSLA
ncbi:MAG: putative baseplate assembly protein [Verrucomicrobia bacterium]|nr:putative baseplate assembly protein [Verrucomicrobiota bacterium]